MLPFCLPPFRSQEAILLSVPCHMAQFLIFSWNWRVPGKCSHSPTHTLALPCRYTYYLVCRRLHANTVKICLRTVYNWECIAHTEISSCLMIQRAHRFDHSKVGFLFLFISHRHTRCVCYESSIQFVK